MDYSHFKGIQFLLFFGVALGFGLWQVIAIKRDIRRELTKQDPQEGDPKAVARKP